jgi:hypothetical protein
MPTIFRTMKEDLDGGPVVGNDSKELGVRVFPANNPDVTLDNVNMVLMNGEGMSVAIHWSVLLPHLIPRRLKPLLPDARGSDSLSCYRIGSGRFESGPLNEELNLALKPGKASLGNLVPNRSMSINEFQGALAATRTHWRKDETPLEGDGNV